MKLVLLNIAALLASASCPAAERRVLSTSPSQQVAIIEERSDSGDRDYYFIRQSDNQRLGFVLPAEQRNEISNVHVVASWSPRGTKVALLVFYGTKLSELLIFRRNESGTFGPVTLSMPDPIALYRKRTGKTPSQTGDGWMENGVGPWLDEDTVSLISGEAKQTDAFALEDYLHLLVTFRARIVGGGTKLSHLQVIGPLNDDQSERFLKKWGTRYTEDKE